MLVILDADDDRLGWEGVVSVERTDEWVRPWQIPYDQYELFPPDGIGGKAVMPAGVRITFRSNSTTVAGKITPQTEEPYMIDLCIDAELLETINIVGQDGFAFEGLRAAEKIVELWLPLAGEFRLSRIELDDGATVGPFEDDRPRWITYGSSITQCTNADSPAQTWPGIVARRHGLNLTCLGFAGNCHLEPMVARMIRDLPADFISLCVGINIFGDGSLNIRTFRPAVIGFVHVVREQHPKTPLVVISPIYYPDGEACTNPVGMNLKIMRQEVAAAVQTLQAHGDSRIHYIDGLELLGPDVPNVRDLVLDGLHPNGEGYKLMAEKFLEKVAAKIFA